MVNLNKVAALLTVHMPEEEAFALFTTIMHDYGFRSLYLHSFNELRLRFWILESLIESSLPSLSQHFKFLGRIRDLLSIRERF